MLRLAFLFFERSERGQCFDERDEWREIHRFMRLGLFRFRFRQRFSRSRHVLLRRFDFERYGFGIGGQIMQATNLFIARLKQIHQDPVGRAGQVAEDVARFTECLLTASIDLQFFVSRTPVSRDEPLEVVDLGFFGQQVFWRSSCCLRALELLAGSRQILELVGGPLLLQQQISEIVAKISSQSRRIRHGGKALASAQQHADGG